jgi:hypothetical protein
VSGADAEAGGPRQGTACCCPRQGLGRGTGHIEEESEPLRCTALSEAPLPGLGERLLAARAEIERQFGNLVNWGGGLTCLPAWVQTHHRVRLWVQAKLVLTKRETQLTTCSA